MKNLRSHLCINGFFLNIGISALLLFSVACVQKKRSSTPSGGGGGNSENNGDAGGGGGGGGGSGGNSDVILTSDSFNRGSLGTQSDANLGGTAYSYSIGAQDGTWSIANNELVPLVYDDGGGSTGTAVMVIDGISVAACTIGAKLTSVSKNGWSGIAFGDLDAGAMVLVSDYSGYIANSLSGGGDSTPKYYLSNLYDVYIASTSGHAPADGDVVEAQFGASSLTATVTNGGVTTTLFNNEPYGAGVSLSSSSYPALLTVEFDPTTNTTIFDNLIVKNCQ